MNSGPHILLVIARGEAVRNFLYSDTLPELSKRARVTLLSLVDHGEVMERVKPFVERVIPLKEYREHTLTLHTRMLAHYAHFRWIWSEAVKYYWGLHSHRARTPREKFRWWLNRTGARLLAHRPGLKLMNALEQEVTWQLRPTKDFDALFRKLEPDLVFNCSHIHGPQADLPMTVAKRMGIPTATFVFSWDNLTSRSRIFVPYDYFLMWDDGMKEQLLSQYRHIQPDHVIVTGTPQFDFHFKSEFILSREELCVRVGLDPARPFLLYCTGMDTDFIDEHKFVREVIRFVQETDITPKPQLLVRTYIKGNSPEMIALSRESHPDVVFPPILWDPQWIMPLHEDLALYSSLLHHCALGINTASTVSLELMMLDKPVINIGMEPPGSDLPRWSRFSRHVGYEHYKPIVERKATMVARSIEELRSMLERSLRDPRESSALRASFTQWMFNGTLDGLAGKRVADALVELASLEAEGNR